MTPYRKLLATFACLTFVGVACGNDSNKADNTSAATAGAGTTAATTATASTAATSTAGGAASTTPASSAAAGEDAGLTAAKAAVKQYSDPNQPIGVTIPLTGKPEKKTIAWLECELESCPYETVGMKAATEALGWDLMVISSKSGDPGPAFQQAIDAGVDYIASSGEALALYQEQAQAAKAKGIKILSCYDTQVPDPATTNVYTQCGDATFVQKTGPLMADW